MRAAAVGRLRPQQHRLHLQRQRQQVLPQRRLHLLLRPRRRPVLRRR